MTLDVVSPVCSSTLLRMQNTKNTYSLSIGANVRESKHAQSEADFLSKMSIAYKEADESDYWLNLLHDNGYLDDKQFESLEHDIDRILKILTSIVKTLNEKVKKK